MVALVESVMLVPVVERESGEGAVQRIVDGRFGVVTKELYGDRGIIATRRGIELQREGWLSAAPVAGDKKPKKQQEGFYTD